MSLGLTLEQARARLLGCAQEYALDSVEHVGSDQALGRILATPLYASVSVPPAANSAMDGYALCAKSCRPGVGYEVSQTVLAGSSPAPLQEGTLARIFTGAEIPPGADTVVIQENVSPGDTGVIINTPFSAGDNIRPAGQDVAQGQQVLTKGRRLRPQDLALAASVNTVELAVRGRLKVGLLVTGAELVSPGQPLTPGKIYNSNQPMLSALFAQMGCELVTQQAVSDDYNATCQALETASAQADVIVTTGGVSVGDADRVKAAVESLGQLDFWRVAMKPGKPIAFGRVGQTPFIGLPGNPVSAYVTFQLLLRPFVQALMGESVSHLHRLELPANFTRVTAGRRDEYARGQITADGVALFPQQSSGALSSVVWADCLVYIPAGQLIRRGDTVQVLPMNQWV
ncbi:molybdopterin molybdotransferase MoeA [Gilvimarinus sp. SDUM040013]|uniref:Molybdopterin molybdenumtransferase n=1 Tax=Gilvimarinus gilvus TaxID=3058038 RepID=A0ABU4RZ57_9GAMM|nr:gephyrin-like molybdotransferase Glp [Gilvimarinus sp. SDUM040013]MDO3388651.1 molybdopterin molybdotransferase MoeA [Gilvimarinus sp. SDUM040013]MDX6849546.1 molybdopterin molybdotransferase MoeA [Gilvimarinus sp. SDUM040013]